MRPKQDDAAQSNFADQPSEVALRRRSLLRTLAGAGGIVGLALAALPKTVRAAPLTAPDGIEINSPQDGGVLTLKDHGSYYAHPTFPEAAKGQSFRVLRADGRGYISNNLLFTPSSGGGSWSQDNSQGVAILEEFGLSGWSLYLRGVGGSNTPVFNAEIADPNGGADLKMVAQIPQERLLVGLVRVERKIASNNQADRPVDAALRIIPRSPSLRPLYVEGSASPLGRFRARTNNADALVVLHDGPGVEHGSGDDTSYLALGIDSNGSQLGLGASGAYVSTGKNATGTPRDLILHTYNAKDVIVATNNSEKARFPASGGLQLRATTTPTTPQAAGTVVLYVTQVQNYPQTGYTTTYLNVRFADGSFRTLASRSSPS